MGSQQQPASWQEQILLANMPANESSQSRSYSSYPSGYPGSSVCSECGLALDPTRSHSCLDSLKTALGQTQARATGLEEELKKQVLLFYRRERNLLLKIADLHEELSQQQNFDSILIDFQNQINGRDVSNLSEAAASQVFMQAPEPITVKVSRRSSGGGGGSSGDSVKSEAKETVQSSCSCGKPSPVLTSCATQTEPESLLIPECSSRLTGGDLLLPDECLEEEAIYEDLYSHIMPLPPPYDLAEYQDIVIGKSSGRLGLTLCHGCDDIFGVYISTIEECGAAAKNGQLQIGDQILQINGEPIESKERALELFGSVRTSDITVTVARERQGEYDEILNDTEFNFYHDYPTKKLSPCDSGVSLPQSVKQPPTDGCSSSETPATPRDKDHRRASRSSRDSPSQSKRNSRDIGGTVMSSHSYDNLKNPNQRCPDPSSPKHDTSSVADNVRKQAQKSFRKQHLAPDRFADSSGYCSSNLNSPRMLHKDSVNSLLSHSPSVDSSIPMHGKQYRSYLKLVRMKDDDSVYGVPIGMPGSKGSEMDPKRKAALIRQRAQKMKEQHILLTTDDETISELKTGKYWSREERKRQYLVAREQRQRRYMMEKSRASALNSAQSKSSSGGSGSDRKECPLSLSKKQMREKKEKIIDNFWTIQELLAHGGRLADGSLHPLLSVTTV